MGVRILTVLSVFLTQRVGQLCTVDGYQKKHKLCSKDGSKSPQEEGCSK